MFIYIFNLVTILIASVVNKIYKNRLLNLFLFLLFLQLYLFVALRSVNVGADTISYLNFYENSYSFPLTNLTYARYETGFLFITNALSVLQNPQVYIASLALIPYIFFYTFIKKESKSPLLSLLLFICLGFYTNSFNLMRQFFAMGIILVSYRELKNSNLIKFTCLIVLASLFHVTALIFLPIYFIKDKKITPLYLLIASLGAIGLALLADSVLSFLLNQFSAIEYTIDANGGWNQFLLLVTIFFGSLYFQKKAIRVNPNNTILYNILAVGIFVQVLALNFSLFARVTNYFSMFLIVFIPEMLDFIPDKYIRALLRWLTIILVIIMYLMVLETDVSSILPYEFYWELQ